MGLITSNPTISLQANIGAPLIYYFADGAAIFGCIGSPEGAIVANARSIAITELGAIYVKTTDGVNTGWSLVSGGGGSGTVTSVGMTVPSFLSVSGSPITTNGTLAVSLATQAANLVFAGPSTGAAAAPTFRALVAADLALAAAPPSNGLQYNDGTNAFTASNGFKVDPATNTLQVGELNVLKGTLQLQAGSGGGSYKITTSVPSTNHVWILPDAAPTLDQLLKVSGVSGANYTLGYISPSGLGFPTINATDGVIPYRSSSSAFSDSPITRNGANQISIGNSGAFAGLQITGNAAGSGLALGVLSSSANENLTITPKGVGSVVYSGNSGGITQQTFTNGANGAYNFQVKTNSTSSASVEMSTTPSNFAALVIHAGNGHITVGNGGVLSFSTTLGIGDASIARLGSGIIRMGNGSTGAGQFVVGSSTASTSYQFLSDSQSTTRTAGAFTMPNGSSVPTIQGITNSIQSFALNPTGKIVGGMNIPTTNQQTAMIGNAKSDVSTIGNVGTGTDNLLSFVIQANVLANAGDYAEFDAFGEFAANGNTKQLQVVYGATTIFNTGAVAFTSSNWRMNVKILRTGASAGKSIATFWSSDGTTSFQQEIFITTESFTANKTVQWTATATANDDITQLHLESKLVTALTS